MGVHEQFRVREVIAGPSKNGAARIAKTARTTQCEMAGGHTLPHTLILHRQLRDDNLFTPKVYRIVGSMINLSSCSSHVKHFVYLIVDLMR